MLLLRVYVDAVNRTRESQRKGKMVRFSLQSCGLLAHLLSGL